MSWQQWPRVVQALPSHDLITGKTTGREKKREGREIKGKGKKGRTGSGGRGNGRKGRKEGR